MIVDEKKKLLPKNIFVSEEKASVPLKDMMTKTVDRYLENQECVTFVGRIAKMNNGKYFKFGSAKTGFEMFLNLLGIFFGLKQHQIQFCN